MLGTSDMGGAALLQLEKLCAGQRATASSVNREDILKEEAANLESRDSRKLKLSRRLLLYGAFCVSRRYVLMM